MRGDVDVDPPGQPVLRGHHRDDGVDLIGRTGDDDLMRRGLHGDGDLGVAGEQLLGGRAGQLQQRHRALPGQSRHQPRPGGDDCEALGRRQRTGHHRGRHFAHGVADHGIRRHSVGAPQRGQRQLHPHQDGLDPVDADDGLTGFQDLTQGEPGLLDERRLQLVDGGGEGRLVGQQSPSHPGPLRTLTGIDEHRARPARTVVRADDSGSRVAAGQGAQSRHRLPAVTGGHRAEQGEPGPVVVEGVRDVRQRHLGGGRPVEPVGQPAGRRGNPLRAAAAHHQGADRRLRFGGSRFGDRSLLDEDMGVGATDAERRDSGSARAADFRPVQRLGGDDERGRTWSGVRGELGEVQLPGNVSAGNAQDGLDEAGDTGRRLQMAQVGLDRAQHQRRRTAAVAVDLAQRVQFYRIAQSRAGAVRLDVVDLRRCQAGRVQRLAHQGLLGRTVGDGLAATGAILVDRGPAHHGQNRVAVALGVLETFENHDPAALAAHVTVGIGVEGFAGSVRGEHSEPGARDAVLRAQDQVHPGGQGGVTFPAAQAFTRQMDGDQRRRARAVQDYRRAAGAEEVGQPPGREVGCVPERDVGVDLVPAQLSGHRVVVVVGGQADEHAGLAAANRVWVDPRVLQCLPGDFEQQSLLGVDRRGFAWGDVEELGVELIGLPGGQEPAVAIADGARHGVVVGVVGVGVPAVGRHPDDATGALVQERPEFVGAADPARQPAADAHHGDRLGGCLLRDREARGQIIDLAQRLGDDRAAVRRRG